MNWRKKWLVWRNAVLLLKQEVILRTFLQVNHRFGRKPTGLNPNRQPINDTRRIPQKKESHRYNQRTSQTAVGIEDLEDLKADLEQALKGIGS
jgi:hypothetical protein